ncbi:hypothetical protein CO024_01500 [Candidatus Gracilibacteria bacterium CG_4_9_14_0_2_um_filter_38_7]|nr:MAG: hypothetical protein AUJ87_02795 [Candidatus Gracilibacteria bacterium CG1_02_38_174]PJC56733.1 MAG: hypothetical protein CO024_01500 [Candidatus Gracilibacteria bacterium CG_4_9_14_0_2_um_filter_38_7]
MVSFVTSTDPFVKNEWVSEESIHEARQETDRLIDKIVSEKNGNLVLQCKNALVRIFGRSNP